MSDFDDFDAFEAAAQPTAAPVPVPPRAPGRLSQMAMAARPMPYLDGLNAPQRQAVETLDGPVLMLAGAGTGKTRALTARIAHLLNTGRARPDEVLAVTFTNKAAREMKDRVGHLMGGAVEGMPWLGTFHSVGVKLLRRHAEMVGLKSNFTILDTDDQVRLLKQLIIAENMDEKKWAPREMANIISSWKDRALSPETLPSSEGNAFNGRGGRLYKLYQERLRTLNAVDFGDLLLHIVTIFQKHDDILARYQDRFRFILVDEYQDTNVAQYLWLRLLAAKHKNICCVGDDDQSIYGWRGAEVGNILRFEQDYPGTTVIRLEENYRSTPHILAAASSVIAQNEKRLGKTLWTQKQMGEKVRLIGHWDGDEEARWIGDEAEALSRGTRNLDPVSLDSMAILVRASHQMRSFEERFLRIGLPYRVIGGPRFYERAEIRDAMAYFRVTLSRSDDLAFERIVNTPKRGVGDKALLTLRQIARRDGCALVDAAETAIAENAMSGKAKVELAKLLASLRIWRAAALDGADHIALSEQILDESGYTAMWQADKTPDAPGRLENLKELIKAMNSFENLQGFLEDVALNLENVSDENGAKLSIMTLHAAKGLEFPVVFLPGWEEGLFPSQRSMDESGLKGLEEERRLAYVGITRAEQICTISFSANRLVYGQWQSALASRFIDELPAEHVDVLTAPGLYRSNGRVGDFGGGGGGRGRVGGTARHQDDDFAGGSGGTNGIGAAARGAYDIDNSGVTARAQAADGYNSPGWQRLQRQAASGGQARGAFSGNRGAKSAVIDINAASAFTQGDRIFHAKFGYGVIQSIDADNLSIEFDRAGGKMVKAGFVVPADKAGDLPF